MSSPPSYVVAVACHKGGSGRTTTVAALAWACGQRGLSVAAVDATPVPSLSLLVPSGDESWAGVELEPDLASARERAELVLVDCPPLTERAAQRVLAQSDGVLVTLGADPLTLRTLSQVVDSLRQARSRVPYLDLLGMCVTRFAADDPIERGIEQRLRAAAPELFLEPSIPDCPTLAGWALQGGPPPADSAARAAYEEVADQLCRLLRLSPEEFAGLRGKPSAVESAVAAARARQAQLGVEIPPTRRSSPSVPAETPSSPPPPGRLRGLLNAVKKISGRFTGTEV